MVQRLFGPTTLADFDPREIEVLWTVASAPRDEPVALHPDSSQDQQHAPAPSPAHESPDFSQAQRTPSLAVNMMIGDTPTTMSTSTSTMPEWVSRYLALLGEPVRPPSIEALTALQVAHLDVVLYETLDIVARRQPPPLGTYDIRS